MDETKRIKSAVQALEMIIGSRADGRLYVRHLRRMRAELISRGDDDAEYENLRLRVQVTGA